MTRIPLELGQEVLADWRAAAACVSFDSDLFFPGGDAPQTDIQLARSVCSACTVSAECLSYALETNQQSGIWGGTTEEERRSLRRKWLAARRRNG